MRIQTKTNSWQNRGFKQVKNMGRVKQVCPHGVLGIANCRDCQRIQHTERVRELRRQKRELQQQEDVLEKEYYRQNPPVVYVGPVQQTENAKDMAKHIEPRTIDRGTGIELLTNTSQKTTEVSKSVRPCGICVRREDCDVYRRYATVPCKNFKPMRGRG